MKDVIRIKELQGKDDFLNIMLGGVFLGSGGGGPLKAAEEILTDILNSEGSVAVLQPEDLVERTDLNGAVVAFMGSPNQATKGLDLSSPVKAFDSLGIFVTSGKLDFTIPVEIGAGNSLIPIMVAVKKGIAVVDTDGAGRAVPKIQNTTFALECNATPAALANGNVGNEKKAEICNIINMSGVDRENIPDALGAYALKICDTPEFDGIAGLALYLINGTKLASNTIPGTLSLTYRIGEVIRKAMGAALPVDPLEALNGFLKEIGWEFFIFGEGEVIEKHETQSENESRLDYGYVKIAADAGNVMKISYVNENLFAVLNDTNCWAMTPDLICYLTKTGPVSNVEITKGMRVTVLGLPAMNQMRNSKIISSFMQTLKDADIYNGEYITIEELHK